MSRSLPLKTLNDCYDRLLELCDALELVADSLPNRVPRAQCETLARTIVPIVSEAHQCEERVLMPILVESARFELAQVAARLRREHDFDSQVAIEIREALLGVALNRPALPAEATGYLLRSFFESVRRHVHSEQDLLALIADISPPAGPFH